MNHLWLCTEIIKIAGKTNMILNVCHQYTRGCKKSATCASDVIWHYLQEWWAQMGQLFSLRSLDHKDTENYHSNGQNSKTTFKLGWWLGVFSSLLCLVHLNQTLVCFPPWCSSFVHSNHTKLTILELCLEPDRSLLLKKLQSSLFMVRTWLGIDPNQLSAASGNHWCIVAMTLNI